MQHKWSGIEPPSTLKEPGKRLWVSLQKTYGIGDVGGLESVHTACRSEDDIQKWRKIVERQGPIVKDRFGQAKPHPLLAAIRDAESTKRQALAALNLDIEPAKPVGRPAGK